MRVLRRACVAAALPLLLVAGSVPVAAAEPDVTGLWLTEKRKAAVELFPCGVALCGRIAWMAEPNGDDGSLKLDSRNPDPALRDRPWCGMTVITGLEEEKPGVWDSGTFYYPKHGRSYHVAMQRDGDRLNVRAHIGVELLGRTEIWVRADPDKRGCPTAG